MHELVIGVAKAAGWEVELEARSRAWESHRSIDVRLIDRKQRQIVIVECWNTFGDIGAAARSTNNKVRDEEQHAVAIAAGGAPFAVSAVWVIRDTTANRSLLGKYPGAFNARLPASSIRWFHAVTTRSEPPLQPGFVWCDLRATRLSARRRG
jgi:hypothetical protein